MTTPPDLPPLRRPMNTCDGKCPFEKDIKAIRQLCSDLKQAQQDLKHAQQESKSDQREIRTALLGQMTGDQGGLIAKVHTLQLEMERQRRWKIAFVSLSASGIVSLIVGLILTFAKV